MQYCFGLSKSMKKVIFGFIALCFVCILFPGCPSSLEVTNNPKGVMAINGTNYYFGNNEFSASLTVNKDTLIIKGRKRVPNTSNYEQFSIMVRGTNTGTFNFSGKSNSYYYQAPDGKSYYSYDYRDLNRVVGTITFSTWDITNSRFSGTFNVTLYPSYSNTSSYPITGSFEL